MTEYLKNNEQYDESYIIFSDYSYTESTTDHIEVPIIVSTNSLLSDFFYIDLNVTLRPEFIKSYIYYELNYLAIMDKYFIPYFAVKLSLLPSFLFIYLLYPEDSYFKHKFTNILLPSVYINFYDIDNNQFLGDSKLSTLPNWLDICSKLKQNRYLKHSTFEGLVHNFSSQAILNYFYNTYF